MLHSLSVSPTGDFAATHSLRPGRKEESNKNNLKKRPPYGIILTVFSPEKYP